MGLGTRNRLARPLERHSERRGVGAALCLLALERVDAVDLLLFLIVGVIFDALLVERDGLAEELKALVGVALVLTLI